MLTVNNITGWLDDSLGWSLTLRQHRCCLTLEVLEAARQLPTSTLSTGGSPRVKTHSLCSYNSPHEIDGDDVVKLGVWINLTKERYIVVWCIMMAQSLCKVSKPIDPPSLVLLSVVYFSYQELARSSELASVDFWLRGHLKSRDYRNGLTTCNE